MTFRELKDALDQLDKLGVDLDVHANIAMQSGVTKVKTLFTNSQGDLFIDTR